MYKKIALAIALLALSTQSSIPSFSSVSITNGDPLLAASIEHIDNQIFERKTR